MKSEQIDERATERLLKLGVYAAVLGVGGVALAIANVSTPGALALLGIVALWVVAWWPRWLRTFTVTSTVVIERDPATVFAFVSNLENEARFQPNVERVEKLTPGPIRAGTQFSARARLPASGGIGERVFDGIDEIVDYEPNHRLTSRTASGSHFNLDVKTFVPVSNGHW